MESRNERFVKRSHASATACCSGCCQRCVRCARRGDTMINTFANIKLRRWQRSGVQLVSLSLFLCHPHPIVGRAASVPLRSLAEFSRHERKRVCLSPGARRCIASDAFVNFHDDTMSLRCCGSRCDGLHSICEPLLTALVKTG